MTTEINIRTGRRSDLVNITSHIRDAIDKSGIKSGICHVYVPHTTAGVTINEGADPDVVTDIISTLDKLVPEDPSYRHIEGNSDSHIKASLTGSSQSIIIENGKPLLGTWQAVFFCEFDGPRSRKAFVKIIPG